MKQKLQKLMDAEQNMSRSAFAERIDTQPATISHIMSGRNKPGFELLQKILQRFPNINPDWLLLDRGEMLRNPQLPPSGSSGSAAPKETDSMPNAIQGEFFAAEVSDTRTTAQSTPETALKATDRTLGQDMKIPARSQNGSAVERIIVFYADRTFDSFEPKH